MLVVGPEVYLARVVGTGIAETTASDLGERICRADESLAVGLEQSIFCSIPRSKMLGDIFREFRMTITSWAKDRHPFGPYML